VLGVRSRLTCQVSRAPRGVQSRSAGAAPAPTAHASWSIGHVRRTVAAAAASASQRPRCDSLRRLRPATHTHSATNLCPAPPALGRALTGPHEWSDASHVPRAVEGYTRPRPRPPRTGAAPPSMAGRAPDWSRAGRASSGRDRPSFAPHRRRPHPAGPRDDRAVALRVLLTFVQARMLLLCIQTLVPVKHVEGSGEVIVQGIRLAEQRIQ
jgi:hypothetical protein